MLGFYCICSSTPSFENKVHHSKEVIRTTDTVVIAEAVWHYIQAIRTRTSKPVKCPKSDI